MNTFFIGDLHLGHKNIMQYCNRPFTSLDDMHEGLIHNWNKEVNAKDNVWVMGDVTFNKKYLPLLNELNGTKRLIMGNHDTLKIEEYLPYFSRIFGTVEFSSCILTHIPVSEQQLVFRFDVNVHGHVHHLKNGLENDLRYFNVCADHVHLTPVHESLIHDRVNIVKKHPKYVLRKLEYESLMKKGLNI